MYGKHSGRWGMYMGIHTRVGIEISGRMQKKLVVLAASGRNKLERLTVSAEYLFVLFGMFYSVYYRFK